MLNLLSQFKPLHYIFTAILSLSLAAPVFADSDVLDGVIESGILRVGMTGDQPPFNALNRSGDMMGFDVDLANSLATAMSAQLEIVTLPFGDLLEALDDGKVDMVMSGMAITPERSQTFTFIGPYMISGKSMLTSEAAIQKASANGGYNSTGMRLVALENSTSAVFVSRNLPNATLITIPDYDSGINMLLAGDADVMVADLPVCKLAALRNPGLITLNDPLSIEPVGIAIASEDPQFQNLVENYLDTYEKLGLLSELKTNWFENSAWIMALP